LKIIPVKTRIFHPPRDDIFDLMENFLPKLQEKDVVLITSKIVAIHQGRCFLKQKIKNKISLIKKEADFFLPSKNKDVVLTIKNNTFIASAGIDESNADGYLIAWPKNPQNFAKKIWQKLREKFNIKNLGIIITDSHLTPMRSGVLGISIGFFGFNPLLDYRGKKDIFGRQIKFSQLNLADSLSAMGVLVMGEGNEKKPIAIIRNANFLEFSDQTFPDFFIPKKEDLFSPILENFFN